MMQNSHSSNTDQVFAAPRIAPQKPVILIPARMASSRLPNKPLADIAGLPMIVQVWKRAVECKIVAEADILVACDGPEIASAVEAAGGRAIVTAPSHPSGSDRIWEALGKAPGGDAYDSIINLQGDLPTLDPKAIKVAFDLLANPSVDIGTLVVPIVRQEDKEAGHIVKAVLNCADGAKQGRALYFSRMPVPAGAGALYHHIGIYTYRRDALARFVATPQAHLEKRESLEQLRALVLGMHIEAGIIDTIPLGVDTVADLEIARQILGKK